MSTLMRFFDKDGSPLDVLQWAVRFDDPVYCQIALDEAGGWTVSTVWTGNPNSAIISGALLDLHSPRLTEVFLPIFGTGLIAPVYDEHRVGYLHEAWLYDNLEAAERGHRVLVDWLSRPGVVPLVCGSVIDDVFLGVRT